VQGVQRPVPRWWPAAGPGLEYAGRPDAGQPNRDQQRPRRRRPEEAPESRAELGQAPREGAGQGDDGTDQGPAAAVPRSDRGILQDPGEEPGAVGIGNWTLLRRDPSAARGALSSAPLAALGSRRNGSYGD